MTNQRQNRKSSPLGGIIGIAIFALIIFVLFQMVSGIFTLLSWLAPILFILALIYNRNVVFDYGKMLGRNLKNDLPRGLVYSALSVLGFPVLSAFLFFKAFVTHKAKKKVKEKEDTFDDYEEVEDDEDFLDLPEMEISKETRSPKTKSKETDSTYDDLFK